VRDQLTRWPWFAIAFALYPVLHVAAVNPGQVEPSSLLLAASAVAAAALACLGVLRALLGSWYRAGLATLWAVLLFFSFGIVAAWLQRLTSVPDELDFALQDCCNPKFVLAQSVVWGLLLLLGFLLARRLPAAADRAVRGLNLVAGLLCAMVMAQWLLRMDGAAGAPAATPVAGVASERPDIYLIVLDGYARADVLERHYGFDNGPFLDALRHLGFTVNEASTSNYYWTDLSLPSLLNYDYLPALLGDSLRAQSTRRDGVYRLTRDSRAAAFLRARGYRYLHLQSTWGATGANPQADEFLPCGSGVFRDDFLRALAELSWLYAISSRAALDLAQCHLQNLDSLASIAPEPGPKFVFAHFLPPHHPYLFDHDGRILRNARLSDQFDFQNELWEQRAPYLEQLRFMNRRIEEAIGHIIAGSASPPVILLVSDHGPNLRYGLDAAAQQQARFANLSAVHLPCAEEPMPAPGSSAVNLFRHVFNRCFDAGFAPLPDRHFVSPFQRPFALTEVADAGTSLEAVAD